MKFGGIWWARLRLGVVVEKGTRVEGFWGWDWNRMVGFWGKDEERRVRDEMRAIGAIMQTVGVRKERAREFGGGEGVGEKRDGQGL